MNDESTKNDEEMTMNYLKLMDELKPASFGEIVQRKDDLVALIDEISFESHRGGWFPPSRTNPNWLTYYVLSPVTIANLTNEIVFVTGIGKFVFGDSRKYWQNGSLSEILLSVYDDSRKREKDIYSSSQRKFMPIYNDDPSLIKLLEEIYSRKSTHLEHSFPNPSGEIPEKSFLKRIFG